MPHLLKIRITMMNLNEGYQYMTYVNNLQTTVSVEACLKRMFQIRHENHMLSFTY